MQAVVMFHAQNCQLATTNTKGDYDCGLPPSAAYGHSLLLRHLGQSDQNCRRWLTCVRRTANSQLLARKTTTIMSISNFQPDSPEPHQAANRHVLVGRFNRRLAVDGMPPEVEDLLVTTRHVAVPDPDHGYRLERQCLSMHDRECFVPTAGFTMLAALVARELGYTAALERSPLLPLPAPDLSTIPEHRCDGPSLDFMHRHAEGLIWYRRGVVEVAWLVDEVCRAYPTARIAVVEASMGRLRPLVDKLRELGLESVAMGSTSRAPERDARIVVATWYGLADVETEHRHILLVTDARQALSQRGHLVLQMVDGRFRLFGALPRDARLSPQERDQLHAIFGFEETYVPRHGHVVRPVRVAWQPHGDGPALPPKADVLHLKKNGLWNNSIRNRRIARLARAIADGATAWLDTQAPDVARGIGDLAGHRTVVLVENVDHAVAIAQRLPGWPIVTGPKVDCRGLAPRQRELLSARGTPRWQYPGAIVTVEGLQLFNLDETDVVIWAGAGIGPAPIPEDNLVVRSPQDRPLLVVDVRDRQPPVLRRWAFRRKQEYDQQGWGRPGREPVAARMIQFLATRPRRRR